MRKGGASDPVDVHLGAQVRLARNSRDMTQQQLGDALGITFQQVQKYEKGTNRIGGARLWEIAKALDVPPAYFFDGLAASADAETETSGTARNVMTFATTREGVQLITRFRAIESDATRRAFLDLIGTMAPGASDDSDA